MNASIPNEVGLVEALAVAAGEEAPEMGEADSKLLLFVLGEGECTIKLTESTILIWFSWLSKPTPSRYFVSLAPGLVAQLWLSVE